MKNVRNEIPWASDRFWDSILDLGTEDGDGGGGGVDYELEFKHIRKENFDVQSSGVQREVMMMNMVIGKLSMYYK